MAVGSNNKSLHVLRLPASGGSASAGGVVRELDDVHRGSVYCCDWSAPAASLGEGECFLASGSNDKTVRISRCAGSVVAV